MEKADEQFAIGWEQYSEIPAAKTARLACA